MMRNTSTQLVLAFIEMMSVFLAENCHSEKRAW
jgi:hypothetical protein